MCNSENPSTTGIRDRSGAVTHQEANLTVRPLEVQILEMEDVLFHLNSAVLMPERPAEEREQSTRPQTDTGADEATEEQTAVSGIRALALVFKEIEFDPRKRIIIAGHTDTSGEPEYNFDLSDLRARNVLYLLKDEQSVSEPDEWADICYGKQRVEDYQQILRYFAEKLGWVCNPGNIDNIWGSKTEAATNRFIITYNIEIAAARRIDRIPENAGAFVRNDGQHRWTKELWKAVYVLYSDELSSTLNVTPERLNTYRRERIRFIDPQNQFVGCGESFPLASQDDNYRSQADRRVEILLCRPSENVTIDCPARRDSVHTAEECPLYHDFRRPTYVPGNDLNGVAYHFRFKYYDRITKETTDVPNGLQITAWVDGDEVNSRIEYTDGLYMVVVQFANQSDAEAKADRVVFKFETENKWIYTENDSTAPTIVTKEISEIEAMEPSVQFAYYDLPAQWSSQNWVCRVGTDFNDFEHFMENRTSVDSPIVFNFDDIVLVKSDLSQAITDKSAADDFKDASGSLPALSDEEDMASDPPKFKSRVRILYIDHQDKKMKLYSTEEDPSNKEAFHNGSMVYFSKDSRDRVRNFITYPPIFSRAVVFCGEFYDVARRRTSASDPEFSAARGHVIGARAARINDSDVHHHETVRTGHHDHTTHCPGIGDFEIHYFDKGYADGNKFVSHLLIYWSGFIIKDTKPTAGGTGRRRPATQAQIDEFRSIGMLNSMEHWNKKEYQFDEHGRADDATYTEHEIHPFFFFEANEALKYSPPTPLDHKRQTNDVLDSAAYQTALTHARGGRPKTLVFITEEAKGSWVRSHRHGTPAFSAMSLRIKTREDDPTRFSSKFVPQWTEFGDPGQYGCLVMAHELGHATGQVDDYTDTDSLEFTQDDGTDVTRYFPTFGQFGRTTGGNRVSGNNSNFSQRESGSEAFSIAHDDATMMDMNGPIRIRHVWRFAHWVNENAKNSEPLHRFLSGSKHELHYPRSTMQYFRDGSDIPTNPWEWAFTGKVEIDGDSDREISAFVFEGLGETGPKTRPAAQANSAADLGTPVFKGILTIRPLINLSFRRNGADRWNREQMITWAHNLNRLFNSRHLNGKFKLTGGGGRLDPTVIRFIPGYDFQTSPPADCDLRIEVKRNSNDAISQSGSRIRLGDQIPARQIFNYIFGKAYTGTPATDRTFTTGDLEDVRDWFRTLAIPNANVFRIEEI